MKKVVRRFDSFEESDRADRSYYARLDPQERLEILLDLLLRRRAEQDEATEGFVRAYRVVELAAR